MQAPVLVSAVPQPGIDDAEVFTVPPGKLGASFAKTCAPGVPCVISSLAKDSPLIALGLAPGSVVLEVDGLDVSVLTPEQLTDLLLSRSDASRAITVLRPKAVDQFVEKRMVVAAHELRGGALEISCNTGVVKIDRIEPSSEALGHFPNGTIITAVNDNAVKTLDDLLPVKEATIKKVAATPFGVSFIKEKDGAIILDEVNEGGLAFAAGLRRGVEVVAVDAKAFSDTSALANYLKGLKNGASVAFKCRESGLLTLTLLVPKSFKPCRLAYVMFVPTKRDCGGVKLDESLSNMRARMNAFLASSDLSITSVESDAVEGYKSGIKNEETTRHVRVGQNTVIQTLRVWYNALDPANKRPHVIAAILKQEAETDAHIASGCVLM